MTLTDTAALTPAAATLDALAAELREVLGSGNVSTEGRVRERASLDGAWMSPIISEQLPLGLADVVAFPTSAELIAATVGAAVRHGVPITPRGKGTGNYGQAIPLAGGLVLDLTRARAVVEVGDGFITAEAGAQIVMLEQAAWKTDQALWMYPSTAQSTIGGFLSGGSGGTGTIEHGSNDRGFVVALDVVHADPSGVLVHVEGDAAQQYVHNYGTAGIIARATVRLEPLRDWRGVYASFPDLPTAMRVIRQVGHMQPPPRLVSADNPEISEALPADDAIPAGRASLRAIVSSDMLHAVADAVDVAGGRIEAVREGPQTSMRISMLSYNHPIEWYQKATDRTTFHVEVSGEALIDRLAEVEAVYPHGLLHIEAGHSVPIGMLAGAYESAEQVYEGIARLNELGVGVHNPHQWNVDFELERTVRLARTTDPTGLLNPGKLNPDYAGPRKGAIK